MAKRQFKDKYKPPKGYIPIPVIVIDSEAYIKLKPAIRALLIDIARNAWPYSKRNGHLVYTAAQAKKRMGISKNSFTKYITELIQSGFLELTEEQYSYTLGKAREYQITFYPTSTREPKNTFLNI